MVECNIYYMLKDFSFDWRSSTTQCYGCRSLDLLKLLGHGSSITNQGKGKRPRESEAMLPIKILQMVCVFLKIIK